MNKTNNIDKFIEKAGMAKARYDVIQPISVDLSKDTLLLKCLHGKRQNTNEVLNNLIWNKCPKNVFFVQILHTF